MNNLIQKTKKSSHSPTLIAGLGNPGDEFLHSPHNVGFDVLDMLAEKFGAQWEKEKDALASNITIAQKKIVLAKPLSFMNKSGTVIARLQKFYHLNAENIWVIHDDIDLPLGTIKIVQNRGAAGHKGVASIIAVLKTQNFIRFRVGTSTPRLPKNRSKELMVKIVTRPFAGENKKKFQESLSKCADAISLALEKGVAQAMNETNQR